MCRGIHRSRARAFHHQRRRCYYCGVSMWLSSPTELGLAGLHCAASKRLQCTAEHLQARCDGGSDQVANIAAACWHCNQLRHRRRRPLGPTEFLQYVQHRVRKGAWHERWVFACGLL
jgi:hypothetical protein